MAEDVEDTIAAIASAIRRYFELHPDAVDTVVGIQQWWLPASLLDEPLALIELALDQLVEEGGVRRTEHGDGSVSYSSVRHGRMSEGGNDASDASGGSR